MYWSLYNPLNSSFNNFRHFADNVPGGLKPAVDAAGPDFRFENNFLLNIIGKQSILREIYHARSR
jgi:hypothetical protein